MREIIQDNVITADNRTVTFDKLNLMSETVMVPLQIIKEYKYDVVFESEIPIFYREIFKKVQRVAHDWQGFPILMVNFISEGIE